MKSYASQLGIWRPLIPGKVLNHPPDLPNIAKKAWIWVSMDNAACSCAGDEPPAGQVRLLFIFY